MASPSTATPETLVTLKVNLDGTTRRFKLPLRDVGANTLEAKVRGFLQIPPATTAVLERYSDSAATFVVLDPNNVSVYKQLFRAAKAKQKLKLRVTTTTEEPKAEQEPRVAGGPKPATVKEEPLISVEEKQKEPDTTVEHTAPRPTSEYSTPAPQSTEVLVSDTIVAPQVAEEFPDFIEQWRARGMPKIHLRRDDSGVEVIDFRGPATSADPMVTLAPLPEGSSVSLDKTLSSDRHQYRFSETASTLSFSKLYHQARAADAKSKSKTHDKKVEVPNPTFAAPSAPVSKMSDPIPASPQESLLKSSRPRPFTVCCNSCDKAVPNAHYHCSSCDDGDFDLCVDCVDRGITCYDDTHWLIKRTIENGLITYSTTQVAPRSSRCPASCEQKPDAKPEAAQKPSPTVADWHTKLPVRPAEKVSSWDTGFARTCNSCVQEYPERDFLHCNACEDYDLCQTCFTHDQHGHNPSHSFSPAVKDAAFSQAVSSRLPAGRNVAHNAICDGCDKYVYGVRHKCLECPDWDYCSECVVNANFIHPNHRFVALFEPIAERISVSRAVHSGICCDGPLCKSNSKPRYIVGERYKCAVCNDLDFCANCEASPANLHNKTHPLIKFQTPVRHVSVTTTGEHMDGQFMPTMGDRANERAAPYRLNDQGHQRNREMRRQLLARARHMANEALLSSRSVPKEEPAASSLDGIAVNTVRTVVDVEPTEPQEVKVEKAPVEADQVTLVEEKEPEQEPIPDLVAIFKHDTVEDGTIMPPNHTFEQTWVLRNEGNVAWPAGCTVKFVGGDYMGAVDPMHPAGIHELVSASESTVCYNQLKPGQEFPFTVLMRTPDCEGKVISYWRLTTANGHKFGHKLWCDVNVQSPPPKALDETVVDAQAPEIVKSQMIIPKLDHESPASSLHVSESKEEAEADNHAGQYAPSVDGNEDDFEDCAEDESWAEQSDDGFMTDEEYDILDASDDEYLFKEQKGAAKK